MRAALWTALKARPRDRAYLFSDLQSPLAQRFSFLVLPPLSIQHSQVVQCCCNLGSKTENLNEVLFFFLWFALLLAAYLHNVRTHFTWDQSVMKMYTVLSSSHFKKAQITWITQSGSDLPFVIRYSVSGISLSDKSNNVRQTAKPIELQGAECALMASFGL